MSLVLLGLGTCTLGRTTRDKDGNITSQSSPQWVSDPDGGSVLVTELDPETMQPIGDGSVFGDWAAAEYLSRALELLHPSRPINIPDFKSIVQKAAEDGNGDIFCEYCPASNCRDCKVKEWKEET